MQIHKTAKRLRKRPLISSVVLEKDPTRDSITSQWYKNKDKLWYPHCTVYYSSIVLRLLPYHCSTFQIVKHMNHLVHDGTFFRSGDQNHCAVSKCGPFQILKTKCLQPGSILPFERKITNYLFQQWTKTATVKWLNLQCFWSVVVPVYHVDGANERVGPDFGSSARPNERTGLIYILHR